MHSESPHRLNTLPVDILIDIFKSLPNFNHLLPLLLAHRAFHEVWKANFNEISQAIARHEIDPWDDAVNLMLEQRHPSAPDVIAPRQYPLRFSPRDLGQLHSNAQCVQRLLHKHRAAKDVWATEESPAPLETEATRFCFRRAAYRVWLFMLTIELPRCEVLCDVLSLVEMVEMQIAAKHFGALVGWPGSPDFSLFPPGTAVMSLEGVMRRRIADYGKCEPDVDMDEVHDLKRHYAALGLQDPEVRGKEMVEKRDMLVAVEKRWREKQKEVKLE